MKMELRTRPLFVSLVLMAACHVGFGAICLEGTTKDRAEKELGVVIKRASLGPFTTNEVGVVIEFAPSGKLREFMFAQLDIYLELPRFYPLHRGAGGLFMGPGRRLTSVTLKPREQTEEKIVLFFTVDPEYLERTHVILRVQPADGRFPDGYEISLKAEDFRSAS